MNKNAVYLGIDTSNYTTSVSVCDTDGRVILNSKNILDVKEGERGLRQSDAVFAHLKNLPSLSTDLANALRGSDIVAVGVSRSPRDEEGSYMPCFMSGRAVASIVAATHDAELYEFSHQSGHIMAALYSCGNAQELIKNDFAAFHVSGGTTEVLYVKPTSDGFNVRIIGNTADISAGQAIDRAGVMMGLRFPCGKELEKLALMNDKKLPKPKLSVKNGICNLSGLENIAEKIYRETGDKPYVAAYVLNFIAQTLLKITEEVREKYPDIPIVYAGGVMSNAFLKETLGAFKETYFATPEFSSDNAAGIALLTRKLHINK